MVCGVLGRVPGRRAVVGHSVCGATPTGAFI